MRSITSATSIALAAVLALVACSDLGRPAGEAAESVSAGPRDMLAATAGTLSLGGEHSCAVARRGIVCWGQSNNGVTSPPPLSHIRRLAAGAAYECAIDDDGVKCWGSNVSGQLDVPVLQHPVEVTAGSNHTCAIDDDGVKCWGANASNQLAVPEMRRPTVLRAGGAHTCAIDDDGVKCWGSNTSGQTTVPPLRAPTALSLGTSHSCAIDADGVKCWGQNAAMQTNVPPTIRGPRVIGLGAAHSCVLDVAGVKCWGSDAANQQAIPLLRRPTDFASGRAHLCAIDDGDSAVCWGSNLSGQAMPPADLPLFGRHLCAITNGALRCVGDNEHGQVGVGDDVDRVAPIATAPPTDLGASFGAPVQVSVGRSFGCALGAGGAVKCWGVNALGQLGLGDTRDRGMHAGEMSDALPALRFDTTRAITKIDVGENHACALDADGALFCWGKNSTGQLGIGSIENVGGTVGPARALLGARTVRDFVVGLSHTCALTTDGAVVCFGDNDDGQLGTGRDGAVGDRPSSMGDAMQPVDLGAGFEVASIASGDNHVCALAKDGRVKCWGEAASGQLGLGDAVDRGKNPGEMSDALPAVDVGHGQVVLDLACGARHCCVRLLENTMKCWGDNAQGQLGLGDVVNRGTDASTMGDDLPFVITPPHERVLSIAIDGNRTCARTESGLRCWGRNVSGELGYGDHAVRGATPDTVPRLLAPLGI